MQRSLTDPLPSQETENISTASFQQEKDKHGALGATFATS